MRIMAMKVCVLLLAPKSCRAAFASIEIKHVAAFGRVESSAPNHLQRKEGWVGFSLATEVLVHLPFSLCLVVGALWKP